MTDTFRSAPTSAEVAPIPGFLEPGTRTIEERARDIADRAGHIRNQTNLLGDDAADLQHNAFRLQLDNHVADLARQRPVALLERLSMLGFAWRDIARMVGVSIPALRRWRNGEPPSGDNRRAIAQLLAFAEIIQDDHLLVQEVASWMEVPIVGDAPVTPIDLYAAGRLDTVYDLAARQCTPEGALDQADPGWREKYRTDWEVAVADDGQPYLRLKPER